MKAPLVVDGVTVCRGWRGCWKALKMWSDFGSINELLAFSFCSVGRKEMGQEDTRSMLGATQENDIALKAPLESHAVRVERQISGNLLTIIRT